ncbi:hypothetical protein L1987_77952 [Smallanthus sonchifolius]|uniref:Uncharacterized protein n=1 Tax=Smallanthus sonchifolius TaxID=185202 RepID=A0ACB8ZBT7_9ASTR|nr:hypothetical protein L1987_77952 [Smallanthus sonchifolius]
MAQGKKEKAGYKQAKDLENCFGAFGEVVDAYVAAKRDKAGGLFGFVRFTGVKDKWEMERSMSAISLNNAMLAVNLAKFDKERKPNRRDESKYPRPHYERPVHHQQEGEYVDRGGGNKSCRDALLWNQHYPAAEQEVTVPEDADSEMLQWYDLSVVGTTTNLNQLCSLHQIINNDGQRNVTLKYLMYFSHSKRRLKLRIS